MCTNFVTLMTTFQQWFWSLVFLTSSQDDDCWVVQYFWCVSKMARLICIGSDSRRHTCGRENSKSDPPCSERLSWQLPTWYVLISGNSAVTILLPPCFCQIGASTNVSCAACRDITVHQKSLILISTKKCDELWLFYSRQIHRVMKIYLIVKFKCLLFSKQVDLLSSRNVIYCKNKKKAA